VRSWLLLAFSSNVFFLSFLAFQRISPTICECIIKSIIIGPRSIAGVPLSQVAPAYLITAQHPVCVPAVLGALAVWRLSTKKKIFSLGLPYYCAPLVCVSEVIESLAVWRYNKPKTKTRHGCEKQMPSAYIWFFRTNLLYVSIIEM